ncbi:hypothetical protein IHE29_02805 (plasmid) [Mycetohabitans rhizoxinica]|uniref:Uncharacterized protein n=1 Tax=Mycetohabitans rhizoxinica TaxID=412963 RepID=A0ABZ2PT38_9BURK
MTTQNLLGKDFVPFTSDQIGGSLSSLTVFRDQKNLADPNGCIVIESG